MEADGQDERETRAAVTQSMFRTVNEKVIALDPGFETETEAFTIACECADTTCVEMLDIRADAYRRMRENPRRFAVLSGHVYPDVETVVGKANGYVVVEKAALAGEIATQLAGQE